jgi:hypothetical protein
MRIIKSTGRWYVRNPEGHLTEVQPPEVRVDEERPTTEECDLTAQNAAPHNRAVSGEPAWLTAIAERKRPHGVPVSLVQWERDRLVRIARAAIGIVEVASRFEVAANSPGGGLALSALALALEDEP